MTDTHAHNLAALLAVAEFAVLHELPVEDLRMPQTAFNREDAIGVDLGWGDERLTRWLDALDADDWAGRIHADEHQPAASGGTWTRATLATTLPALGVRVQIVARWRDVEDAPAGAKAIGA